MTRNVKVEMIIKGKDVLYRLLESIEVNGTVIPAQFISDGATVPRLFWSVFPPVRDYFHEAVYHDYLLKHGTPWKIATNEFKQALHAANINPLRITVMVAFVRLWGVIKNKD